MSKLNQIIAVEKGIKGRNCSVISDLYKKIQKSDLFNGFSKKYRPKDEEGEKYPPESKKVIFNTNQILEEFNHSMVELFDITATKDWTNCNAFGDVVIDGKILLEKVPASYLLFLEKQINDIKTFIENLPVLDESEDWDKDVNSGLYKTNSISTHKTKKVQKPIVLYEATDKHVAQTQLITEDMTVGYWDTIKNSGSMPQPEKKILIDKVNKLSKAVKFAREEANSTIVNDKKIGEKLFNFLLD